LFKHKSHIAEGRGGLNWRHQSMLSTMLMY